jgi:hypothetical protein
MTPQYTPAQVNAHYQQYGFYPAGYQPPQQTPRVVTSSYGYQQGATCGPPSTSREYGYPTLLATAPSAAR